MKTIAIMNYKGGVGKTVTTINFAAELAAAGKRVIVMDADGQCNLSDIFRADTLHGGTTYEVLTGETGCCWDELVQDTPVESVKIVPASAELPKADIAALTGERLAKNGIRDFCLAVAEDEGADYILIDCPTAYNAATVAALGAADEIIIPVELEGFSLHGAGEIRSQVANMRTVNPRLRIAGALITKRRGTRIQEAAEQALRVSGIPAFEAAIPLRASVPASMSNLNASKTLRGLWRLSLSAKELISSDALIFLRRNGGEAMKYECLKLEERRIIEEMYAKGAKPGEIAERVGKCQATIYRELERGKTGETDSRFRQGYSAAVAEARVNRSYRNRGRRKAAQ